MKKNIVKKMIESSQKKNLLKKIQKLLHRFSFRIKKGIYYLSQGKIFIK